MKVSQERQSQYLRKLEWITDQISNIPPLDNSSDKHWEFFLDAFYYRLQTSIDASMDIIAMLVKDNGETVSDDYQNINKIKKSALIDSETEKNLRSLNGLRNVLVHRYNHIKDDEILNSKTAIIKQLTDFIKLVGKLIEASREF